VRRKRPGVLLGFRSQTPVGVAGCGVAFLLPLSKAVELSDQQMFAYFKIPSIPSPISNQKNFLTQASCRKLRKEA